MAIQIKAIFMCHKSVKMLNLLSPHGFHQAQNEPKSIFGRGSPQDPARWGADDALPDLLVGWGGGYPLPIPLPSTTTTSAPRFSTPLAPRPPRLWRIASDLDPHFVNSGTVPVIVTNYRIVTKSR